MEKRSCFLHSCCVDGGCPNVQVELIDDRYGGGIAEDIGLKKIKCSECVYHYGDCKDCIFQETEYCTNCGTDVREGRDDEDQ